MKDYSRVKSTYSLFITADTPVEVSPGPLGCKKASLHVEYRIIQLSVLDKLFKCPMT